MDTKADTLPEVEDETLGDTRSDMEAKLLIDSLADTVAEVEAEILGNTLTY